jgi:hypothetical protein
MKDQSGFCCDNIHLIDENLQFVLLDRLLGIMVQSQAKYVVIAEDITNLVVH